MTPLQETPDARRHLPVFATMPPLPSGWFSLGLSQHVARGAVVRHRFFGHDLVLFRTESGRLGLLDAHCPHLGAHMGHGGVVVGESIRCPFHGFCFDAEGACTATGYNTKTPAKAVARAWSVVERHGVVLAWHDAKARAPGWEVPDVDTDGWSPFVMHEWSLRGHPQETTENSVDIGHFSWVHGYTDVAAQGDAKVDGPVLRTRYGFTRRFGGARSPIVIREDIDVGVFGLGYSRVEATDRASGARLRLLVLPTSEDAEQLRLRIALSIQDFKRTPSVGAALRWLPSAVTQRMAPPLLLRVYAHEVEQDFKIWKNKRYVEQPAIALGDGPIGLYRRWARQFYE